MPIINRVAEYQDEMTAWRRHLHERPELGFQERRDRGASSPTSCASSASMRSIPASAGTGVVAVVRGRAGGRAIGLRADMDALPIEEETGLPWSSQVRRAGCTPAGMTAIPRCCSGAARYLAETRNFAGTAYLIFQPAEEGGGGGRRHGRGRAVRPLPGRAGVRPAQLALAARPAASPCARGRRWPRPTSFTIELTAPGCHAAMPHLGRDPVVAAALLVQAMQTLVSREVDPVDNAVVSITRICRRRRLQRGARARRTLVVPIRTFREPTRERLIRRIGRGRHRASAAAQGVKAAVKVPAGYPATVNTAGEAALGADAAAEIVGEAKVDRDPPPVHGVGGFRLHAAAAARQLHLDGHRRRRRQPAAAQPLLRLQRRGPAARASATGSGWSSGCCPAPHDGPAAPPAGRIPGDLRRPALAVRDLLREGQGPQRRGALRLHDPARDQGHAGRRAGRRPMPPCSCGPRTRCSAMRWT